MFMSWEWINFTKNGVAPSKYVLTKKGQDLYSQKEKNGRGQPIIQTWIFDDSIVQT